ncbi:MULTISPECIES: glycine C-acetyltransferase [Dermabacter]|uniref:2-amino-3-ketobutyrate coenzyme A ligase n=1 Tax=Dermabacter jinjuensis TaxID=1667168 RepID=A0ABM6PN77_9MICO|nr:MULTISPECIES: glycine C-acetyltransferase [Dermabacter]ATH96322.1 glycine C-acetyltransferase [Dermabacter jinjuensis]MCT1955569.1 glycine C-acetyltransferase [Dermabacter hominis]MCT2025285.1 glycine C-acetyltransferase [Dermabacter hominis]MCT2055911.1 glycine C-acetyltransferase [Dermabacter hominis]MCT2082648.1 glycine C-acetyltransferase [Dermabacter hominis]
MYTSMKDELTAELNAIREAGTYKNERPILTPQSNAVSAASARDEEGRDVLNFCANNYLGLADHPELIASAKRALDERGFGMASVRFICGTQDRHLVLEQKLSEFLGTDDTILFSSCFDANGGVFESLFTKEDAIISDELNHASLIDGIRLSKAARYRYKNADMDDLRAQLEAAKGARRTVIVTDGVFSMDGYLAPLDKICDLADEFGALVLVDDSHAVGFMGETGAGTPEHFGVSDRVDIYTGTFGKALGGASGGYVSAHQEIIDVLRQRARPYLFSNSLAPAIVEATITALDLVKNSGELRTKLFENAEHFRSAMTEAGFELLEGEHAIVPVMFGDAALAGRIADRMLEHGVYVTAFSYPVVPKEKARIRVQLSAAHTSEDIDRAVQAFVAARDAEN